jgi:Sulfotransferase domain
MKFLLSVGAEKAGTTWLYEYFREHPNFYTVGKELNVIQRDDLVPTFFDISNSFKQDINNYFSYFQKLNNVSGDFTHYEGSTENIFRLIKNGFEKLDIEVVPVYIMRDPIERAWSAWHMLGGGSNFDMADSAHMLTENYLACKYQETVEALDKVFARPLYFFYEDFFQQYNVDRICDQLGISRYPARIDLVYNKGKYDKHIPNKFIDKFGRCNKNRRAVKFIHERFGHDVPWRLEDYT